MFGGIKVMSLLPILIPLTLYLLAKLFLNAVDNAIQAAQEDDYEERDR